jgi:tetratricopeptide (TPR) repeat protein
MSETIGTRHLDRKFLLALSRGELPLHILAKMSLEHLAELCPHCRKEILAVQSQIAGGEASVHMVHAVLKNRLAELKRQHRRAEQDLKFLLDLSPEKRIDKIQRGRQRFKGSHLVHLLLRQAEQYFTGAPDKAQHFAHIAQLVVRHSPAASAAFELDALIYAYMGNASRSAGNLREADAYFQDARRFAQHFATEPATLGRIDELEGSLRKDQRRFAQAEELFSRALMLYGMSGGYVAEIGRVLVNLGDLYYVQGKPAAAAQTTRFSLQILSPNLHPRLYLVARYNLALQLADAGNYEDAALILETEAALFAQVQEPWLQLRLLCVRAKITDARGDRDTALALFLEAREGFIPLGIGFDVAIVSMELALLHLRAGNTAAVKALAEEMAPLFQAQDVHREAMAALLLFQQAVQQETATVELAEELAAYLKRARENPALRFARRRKRQIES